MTTVQLGARVRIGSLGPQPNGYGTGALTWSENAIAALRVKITQTNANGRRSARHYGVMRSLSCAFGTGAQVLEAKSLRRGGATVSAPGQAARRLRAREKL